MTRMIVVLGWRKALEPYLRTYEKEFDGLSDEELVDRERKLSEDLERILGLERRARNLTG